MLAVPVEIKKESERGGGEMESCGGNFKSWQVFVALRTSLSRFDQSSLSLGPAFTVRRGIFCTVAFVVESHSAILIDFEQTATGNKRGCSSQSSHCIYIKCIHKCTRVPLCF